VVLGPPPAWLSLPAKKHWKRCGGALQELGLLTPLTTELLTRYCVTRARWQTAQDYLQQWGSLCRTHTGYEYAHPYVKLAKELGAELLRLEQELGITVGAQQALGVWRGSKPDDETATTQHEKERFFKGLR